MKILSRLSKEQRKEVQRLLSALDREVIQKGFEIEVDVSGKGEINVVVGHLGISEKCTWSAAYPLDLKIIWGGIERHEKVSHSMNPMPYAAS